MSVNLANVISTELDSLVAMLEAAGIRATRDPAVFDPPGAIVAAPTILGVTHGYGLNMSVPVFLVTPDPGREGADQLFSLLVVAMPLLGIGTALPTLWRSPLNRDGLPAYELSVQLTSSEG